MEPSTEDCAAAAMDQAAIVSNICRATDEVFCTMLGLEAVPGGAYVERAAPHLSEGVMSLIGFAGSWVGAGSISSSASFACKICSHLLMAGCDSVNEEVLDAVGEVTNIIIGNFKTAIEERVGPLVLSVPTVIYGRNFSARSLGIGEWTVVPFLFGDDQLDVRVCLTPNRQTGRAVRLGFTPPDHCVVRG